MILMIRLIITMINIIITGATNTTRSWLYTNFVATVLEPIATAKNKEIRIISHWIKLTKNFCKFYMVAKKVNCSRNPFEKFQTRLNWRVLGILMWYSTCPLHWTKAETYRSMQWLIFEKICSFEKYKKWLQYQFIEATYYKIFKKKCSNTKVFF